MIKRHLIVNSLAIQALHWSRDKRKMQYNFCRKKILQVAVRMSDARNLFATCNEIIFYTRRVYKNVSGILIKLYYDWFLLKKLREKLQ